MKVASWEGQKIPDSSRRTPARRFGGCRYLWLSSVIRWMRVACERIITSSFTSDVTAAKRRGQEVV